MRARLLRLCSEQRVHARQFDAADRAHVRPHLVDHVIGEEQAEGGEGRSELRNEDAPDAEIDLLQTVQIAAARGDQRNCLRRAPAKLTSI